MPPSGQVHDPGLQQERTALAWDRTGLAMMVAAGVLERSLGGDLWHPGTFVAAVAFVVGVVVLVMGRFRYVRRWRRMDAGGGMVAAAPVVTVAITTVALGATALLSVLA